MSQTTIVVCVVLFLFLFFVLCARKSENYRHSGGSISNYGGTTNVGRYYPTPAEYDDGLRGSIHDFRHRNDDIVDDLLSYKDSEMVDLLLDNKVKLCIDEDQREKWMDKYKKCKNWNFVSPIHDWCCVHPPPSCESLKEDMRNDYIKLDSEDVEYKLDQCRFTYDYIRPYHY